MNKLPTLTGKLRKLKILS